jgi:hypothetical protein
VWEGKRGVPVGRGVGGISTTDGSFSSAIGIVGAVLKKIKTLGIGGPGLKMHVLKENSYPAPVLEG